MHDWHAFSATVLQFTKTTSRARFSNISGNVGWFLFRFLPERPDDGLKVFDGTGQPVDAGERGIANRRAAYPPPGPGSDDESGPGR